MSITKSSVILSMFCVAAGAATANTLNLKFIGVGPRASVKVTDSSLGVSNKSINAGELRYQVLAGTTAPGFSVGQIVSTFCMDLTQSAGTGALTLVPLHNGPVPGAGMGLDRAALLRNLYGTSYGQAFSSNNNAAAFQIAVWEIVNEANLDVSQGARGLAGIDLTGGDFKVTNQSTIRALANSFLDSAFAAFKDGLHGFNLMAGVSPTRQDQIFIVSVPTPTAAGLGALGLVGISLRRRRA